MSNRLFCLQNPIENKQFLLYEWFSWFAECILYLLNMHAQSELEKKLWIKPDLCILTNCMVIDWQQTVFPTSETKSKLYTLDMEKRLIIEPFWNDWRPVNYSQYLTTSWLMSNGMYCWLLISQKDVYRALYDNRYSQAI